MKKLPSANYLRKCLNYNHITGELSWRQRPISHFVDIHSWKVWHSRFCGKPAGHVSAVNGYHHICVNYTQYRAHRVIYKLMTGREPSSGIDHRNGVRRDNRWDNIRKATKSQNLCNRGANKNNTTGFKGVYFCKDRNKFSGRIMVRGKLHILGRFITAEEAFRAYCFAAKELHGEFSNTGEVKLCHSQ